MNGKSIFAPTPTVSHSNDSGVKKSLNSDENQGFGAPQSRGVSGNGPVGSAATSAGGKEIEQTTSASLKPDAVRQETRSESLAYVCIRCFSVMACHVCFW